MLCVVAPGQGAQTPGMLDSWLGLPNIQSKINDWSAASKVDLVLHGTKSDADTIRDTQIAQALLVANSLLSIRQLFPDTKDIFRHVHVVAGHSVGELVAAAISGVITDLEAMQLVGVRGRAMAIAANNHATGMTAVLGGDLDLVIEHLQKLNLTAAGTLEELAQLAEHPLPGTKLRPLSVAGAFHTKFMDSAVEALRGATVELSAKDPQLTLLSNRDGAIVDTGVDVLARIVGQVSNPVRWDLCQKSMSRINVTGMLELAPAGTLSAIAKRELKEIQTFPLKTPTDLVDAKEFALSHQRRAA